MDYHKPSKKYSSRDTIPFKLNQEKPAYTVYTVHYTMLVWVINQTITPADTDFKIIPQPGSSSNGAEI
jgi:hypothetical protein